MNTNDEPIRIGDYVSIYPRGKKGTYTADYWQNGKHLRQSLRTRNLKIAKERGRRLELQLLEGVDAPARPRIVDKPLSAAVDEYITYLRTEGRRRKTLVKKEGFLKRKFLPFAKAYGAAELSEITMRVIDLYRESQSKTLSRRSMHNEGVMLKTFFGWCGERKYISENPLVGTKFRRPRNEPLGGPTLEQINQVLAKCNRVRIAPLSLLAFTGMRAGECQHLRREDVDLQNGWIHIVSRPGLETKTGQSWKVPIHPRLRAILEQQGGGKGPWFFTALPSRKYPQGGHHLNMKHVCEDLKKVLRKLGIAVGKKEAGFTLHSLRASFKTICIHAGIPREVVDQWQNHAGRRPTASDAYYRLSDEESQRFMLRVPFYTEASSAAGGPGGTVDR
jgi:integrase